MRITRIAKQERRDRYNLFEGDTYLGSLAADTLLRSGIVVGSEISEASLARLLESDEAAKAKQKAYDLLVRRPHARAELARKLEQRGFPKECIESTLDNLQENGYIDDEAFAKAWIESRAQTRGKRLLAAELTKKGVSREIIDTLLSSIEEQLSLRHLAAQRAQRYATLPPQIARQKLTAYLMGRGYSYGEVVSVLDETS
jgi:regulatory protein